MPPKIYKKSNSSSGIGSYDYEIYILIYFLLDLYKAQQNFWLSYGNQDAPGVDDIVAKTETQEILGQVKCTYDKSKKLSKDTIFGENGKKSIFVYMKYFMTIYQQRLLMLKKKIDVLSIEDKKVESELKNLIEKLIDAFNEGSEMECEYFSNLISIVTQINNLSINEVVQGIQMVTLQMITNISPNKSLTNEVHTNEFPNKTIYNFGTPSAFENLSKLSKKYNLKVSQYFINLFLQKFTLVVITNTNLSSEIKHLLASITGYSEDEISILINMIYENIKKYRIDNNCKGKCLERLDMEVILARYTSLKFIRHLKSSLSTPINININVAIEKMEVGSFLFINTSRDYLVLAQLLDHLKTIPDNQILVMKPSNADPKDSQKLIINSFRHPELKYFICTLVGIEEFSLYEELKQIILELMKDIELSPQFLRYKKMIILYDMKIEKDFDHAIYLSDEHWYDNIKLNNFNRKPNRLSDVQPNYITRRICRNSVTAEEQSIITSIMDKDNLILIADMPGMGKTNLLNSLACQINNGSSKFAVKIDLNSETEMLEGHETNNTTPTFEDFFRKYSILERQVLSIPGVVVLLLDAVDEISPRYTTMLKEFIRTSLSKGAKIILTTRVHFRKNLETDFHVETCTFKHLSLDEQKKLITDIWLNEFKDLKINNLDEKCNNYFDKIQAEMGLLNQNSPIVIPYYAKLLAKLLIESCKTFLKNPYEELDIQENLNIGKLYEGLVHGTLNDFFRSKLNIRGNVHLTKSKTYNKKEYLNYMEEKALDAMFSEESKKDIGIPSFCCNEDIEETMLRVGIVRYSYEKQKNIFFHGNIIYYFVVKWIVRQLQAIEPNKNILCILIRNFLLDDHNIIIQQFLEYHLKIEMNTISSQTLMICGKYLHLYYQRYQENYKQLVLNGFAYILKLFLFKCENSHYIADVIFQHTIMVSPHEAVKFTDTVRHLIDFGAKYTTLTTTGKTLLHIASENGNVALVEYLLKSETKIDINTKDNNEETPILLALNNKKLGVTEILIKKGANFYERSKEGLAPIHYAVLYENIHIVKLLVKQYKNDEYPVIDELPTKFKVTKEHVLQANKVRGWSILHLAARTGNFEIFKQIFTHSKTVLLKTIYGISILQLAALSGNVKLLKYVYETIENVQERTLSKKVLLHYAVGSGNIDTVKHVVEIIAADIDARDENGRTSYDIAFFLDFEEILRYLVSRSNSAGAKLLFLAK